MGSTFENPDSFAYLIKVGVIAELVSLRIRSESVSIIFWFM
jgi:hypothetical protein